MKCSIIRYFPCEKLLLHQVKTQKLNITNKPLPITQSRVGWAPQHNEELIFEMFMPY